MQQPGMMQNQVQMGVGNQQQGMAFANNQQPRAAGIQVSKVEWGISRENTTNLCFWVVENVSIGKYLVFLHSPATVYMYDMH